MAFNWRHSELHVDGVRQEAIAVRWVREDAGAKIPLSRWQLNGVLDCRRKRFEKRERDGLNGRSSYSSMYILRYSQCECNCAAGVGR